MGRASAQKAPHPARLRPTQNRCSRDSDLSFGGHLSSRPGAGAGRTDQLVVEKRRASFPGPGAAPGRASGLSWAPRGRWRRPFLIGASSIPDMCRGAGVSRLGGLGGRERTAIAATAALALDTCDLPSAGGSRPGRQKGLGWAEPASEASEPAVTQQARARSGALTLPFSPFIH